MVKDGAEEFSVSGRRENCRRSNQVSLIRDDSLDQQAGRGIFSLVDLPFNQSYFLNQLEIIKKKKNLVWMFVLLNNQHVRDWMLAVLKESVSPLCLEKSNPLSQHSIMPPLRANQN